MRRNRKRKEKCKGTKRMAFLLVAALTIGSLTACGSQGKAEAGKEPVGSAAVSGSKSEKSVDSSSQSQKESLPSLPEYTPVDPESVPESAESDFIFTDNGNEYGVITGYQGAGGQVKIPEKLGTAKYITIAKEAFKNNDTITWLYLPESIVEIQYKAFYGSSALEEVILSPVTLCDGAFYGCGALRRVEFGERQGEGCKEFNGSNDMGAFQACTNLTEVVFPSTLMFLDECSFAECRNLETVDLSNTELQKIGSLTFKECTSLKNVILPANNWADEKQISSSAFLKCASLDTLQFGGDETYLEVVDGILYAEDHLLLRLPGYDNPNVTVREGTTRIESNAFEYDTTLKSIKFPDSLTDIDRLAFCGCTGLEQVTFAAGVDYIGQQAFRECTSLKEVDLPNTEMTFYSEVFRDCINLEKVSLPDNIEFFGDTLEGEFKGCGNVVFIYKGNEYTFDQANELEEIIREN